MTLILSKLFDYTITYIMLWWVLWFLALPFGIPDRPDPNNAQLGADLGAPSKTNLKRKVAVVSLVALVATILVQQLVVDLF